jgi:hypothetical protein
MTAQSHRREFVLGRTHHRAQSPQGLRDRTAVRGERPALRRMQRPPHEGFISPDGSQLFADATEVLCLHVGDGSSGGPPGEHPVKTSGKPPEPQCPRAAVRDRVEERVGHRHKGQPLAKDHHVGGSEVPRSSTEQFLPGNHCSQFITHPRTSFTIGGYASNENAGTLSLPMCPLRRVTAAAPPVSC